MPVGVEDHTHPNFEFESIGGQQLSVPAVITDTGEVVYPCADILSKLGITSNAARGRVTRYAQANPGTYIGKFKSPITNQITACVKLDTILDLVQQLEPSDIKTKILETYRPVDDTNKFKTIEFQGQGGSVVNIEVRVLF